MNARQRIQSFYLETLGEGPKPPLFLTSQAQFLFGVKRSTARSVLRNLGSVGYTKLVNGRVTLIKSPHNNKTGGALAR